MSEITKYFSLASTSRTGKLFAQFTTKNTSSSSSDEIETPQSKRAHIVKKRSFSVKWLDEPLFEGWLMECDGKPKCKCCNVSLSAKKSDLIKHANTNKHKISSQKIANTKTLNVLFKQQNITKDLMIAD